MVYHQDRVYHVGRPTLSLILLTHCTLNSIRPSLPLADAAYLSFTLSH